MILILPLISSLSRSFRDFQRTAAITDITITFTFHHFFSSLARSKYLFIFFFFFIFTLVYWNSKIHKMTSSFSLVIDTITGLLARTDWSDFISKFQRILWVFSWTSLDLGIYHLSSMSKFNLLHNSQGIIFPT